MTAPNPTSQAYPSPPSPCSQHTYCITGLLTTVYGLDELTSDDRVGDNVACLWLLHPRLQSQSSMKYIAHSTIHSWNRYVRSNHDITPLSGLVAATFDQRNHGSREVDARANQDWRSGNRTHAQDMFANYHGTALDTSLLIDYISSYIFPSSSHTMSINIVCGVSLGGHAAWQCLLHDPRITAGISIVGCPDYLNLMSDRARLTKLASYTETSPQGITFLGSRDFPQNLTRAVQKCDPASLVLATSSTDSEATDYFARTPNESERHELKGMMYKAFKGKRLLNMSGGKDKLVPYRCSRPFVQWLEKAIAPGSWLPDCDFLFENILFDEVGHAMNPDMARAVDRFVIETLTKPPQEGARKASKI